MFNIEIFGEFLSNGVNNVSVLGKAITVSKFVDYGVETFCAF